jgi:hypothetical protein
MVEGAGAKNNSYALVTVSTGGQIAIEGFYKQRKAFESEGFKG